MLGPVLRGETISLEPAEPEDLPLFRAWRADPDVIYFMHYRFISSGEHEEEWYRTVARNESEILWSVRLEGRSIGYTDMVIYWINRSARTGLILGDRSTWGKGYGSEVVRLRTAYAFRELGLERLEADSLAGNTAMHRVLQKEGYQHVGTRHHYVYGHGEWQDAYLFELLRSNWESKPGPSEGVVL